MTTPVLDSYTGPASEAPLPVADPAQARARETTPSPKPRPSWRREPLVHFLLLGGLVFAVDRFVAGGADDKHTIVVGADADREAVTTFRAARGREPNADELRALHRVWLDNEVLYREGLALEVDQGDPAIRERVIFKALSVVDSNVKLPAPDEKTLRAWFEAHRNKYDEPPRFDFQEAALSGQPTEADVRAFVTELNAGMPGDAKAGLRVFKARPLDNLVESYGVDFARALRASEVGRWQAMKTRDGWRAIRLAARIAAKPAEFEPLRGVVMHDWTDDVASEQRTAAVRSLAKKYTIKFEKPTKDDLE